MPQNPTFLLFFFSISFSLFHRRWARPRATSPTFYLSTHASKWSLDRRPPINAINDPSRLILAHRSTRILFSARHREDTSATVDPSILFKGFRRGTKFRRSGFVGLAVAFILSLTVEKGRDSSSFRVTKKSSAVVFHDSSSRWVRESPGSSISGRSNRRLIKDLPTCPVAPVLQPVVLFSVPSNTSTDRMQALLQILCLSSRDVSFA